MGAVVRFLAEEPVTNLEFPRALVELMRERRLSLRAVARAAGVDPAHLSRVLNGAGGKHVSPALATRVAISLDLCAAYFPESRAHEVAELAASDPELRDRIYGEAIAGRRGGSRPPF